MINTNTRFLLMAILAVIILFGAGSISLAQESGSDADEKTNSELTPLPEIEQTDDDAVSEVDEDVLEVKALEFQGNMRINDEQILAVMVTRPGRAFSPDELEKDLVRISEMGFFQAPPKYTAEPMGFGVKIILFLKENPIFTSLDVKITGPGLFTIDEIKELFEYEAGQIISTTLLIENYEKIEAAYRTKGYTAATIMNVDYNEDGVVFIEVNEGIIKEIKVKGNTKTKDIVILREINLNPGDVYDAIQFRHDLEAIFALQLFEDISVEYELTDTQEIVVIVNVTEARTGQFGIGGGYSSQDGFLATFSYSERNFRGMGQRINFLGQLGGPNPDFMLSFYSPQIDKRETSMNTEVFMMSSTDRIRNTDDPDVFTKYTTKRKGGSLGFTRPISSTVKVTSKLSFLEGSIDVEEGEITQEEFEEYASKGLIEGTSNSLALGVIKDTRDFVLDPTTGYMGSLTGTYYGLGGDFNAFKGVAEYRKYYNLAGVEEELVTGVDPSRFHTSKVLAYRIMLGGSLGDLSVFDSFKIGGSDTVRGVPDSYQIGDQVILGNLEYRFPVITNLSGAVFVDSGTAASLGNSLSFDELVTSVGGGIRYRIPFFGIAPLRLDYGYNIKEGDGRISFGFGQLF